MHFLLALQFLTIIPINIPREIDERDLAKSQAYYPLIGAGLGLILWGVFFILHDIFPKNVVSTILVMLLVFITGGLHLDGLADTLDALGSRKSREKMLEIMKDSRLGTMGAVGIMSILILKMEFLSCLPRSLSAPALILMPIMGRWSIALPALLFSYARPEEGKGKFYIEGANFKVFSVSTGIALTLILLVMFSLKGIFLLLIVGLVAILLGKYLNSRLGGLTGDTLGFIIEVEEVITLSLVFLFLR